MVKGEHMKLKHTVHKVKDLIDKVKEPLAIYGNNTKLPQELTESKQYTMGGVTLPDKFILTVVRHGYTNDSVLITIINPSAEYQSYTYLVRKDTELVELTGTTGKKVLADYQEYKDNNIKDFLGHYFRIGADPEIFVTDEKDNLIPAYTFLGSKKDTTVLTVNNQKVYWDGFQAEFETFPGTCLQGVVSEIRRGLSVTLEAARKVNPLAKLSLNTVMQIPSELLATADKEHVSLGCMPSLNVYKHKGEEVEDPRQLTVRSTGGHMHFGVGKLPQDKIDAMVKALDAVIGVACVSLFAKYDNPIRRRYYGMAGEYRLPPHGLEYRVLSNAWMAHPFITHLVYGVARKALKMGENGFLPKWKATEDEIVTCINTCDVELAKTILKRNKSLFKQLLIAAGYGSNDEKREMLFNIFINGMDSVIIDPKNLAGNWDINDSSRLLAIGISSNEVRFVTTNDKSANAKLGIKIA